MAETYNLNIQNFFFFYIWTKRRGHRRSTDGHWAAFQCAHKPQLSIKYFSTWIYKSMWGEPYAYDRSLSKHSLTRCESSVVLDFGCFHDCKVCRFKLKMVLLDSRCSLAVWKFCNNFEALILKSYRVIEKDERDLKPLKLKKYWTDLHDCRLKMFRRVQSFRLTLVNL